MPVTVTLVDHPLVADSLARIRDRDTPNSLFRSNLERIGTLLLAEATRSLRTVDGTVETPLTTAPGAAPRRAAGGRADPARRARLRARRPGADAERRRRLHRHLARRGDVPAPAVRQQAPRVARRPAGDRDRSDAGDGRLARAHGRAAGRARRRRPDHRRVRARRAGRHPAPATTRGSTCTSSRPRSTRSSTSTPSSSPDSETPVIVSSAAAADARVAGGRSVTASRRSTPGYSPSWRSPGDRWDAPSRAGRPSRRARAARTCELCEARRAGAEPRSRR